MASAARMLRATTCSVSAGRCATYVHLAGRRLRERRVTEVGGLAAECDVHAAHRPRR